MAKNSQKEGGFVRHEIALPPKYDFIGYDRVDVHDHDQVRVLAFECKRFPQDGSGFISRCCMFC